MPLPSSAPLEQCQRVLKLEAQAIEALADRLDVRVCQAIDEIAACSGMLVVTGMGKAGLVGQKVSATFAATGTRSFFLHPGEAQHGDLGRVGPDDVALVLSYSGETEEIVKLVPLLSRRGLRVIAITGTERSTLGREASVVIELGTVTEACDWGLIPTTSASLMMTLGDALALGVSNARGFTRSDFGEIHPGGLLGQVASRPAELSAVTDHRDVSLAVETPGV